MNSKLPHHGSSVLATVLKVVIFSIAFAFVESSVVVYLRHLIGASYSEIDQGRVLLLLPGIAFLEPKTAFNIITNSQLLNVEMTREAFTLIMLASVALLAARNVKAVFAYFFLAFGIWDIFYYVFLKLTIDWPKSFTDLDIFFLLPVPWIGPVFVPIIISSLLIAVSLYYLKRSSE